MWLLSPCFKRGSLNTDVRKPRTATASRIFFMGGGGGRGFPPYDAQEKLLLMTVA